MQAVMENLDAPEASIAHSQAIRKKKFLHSIYREHYEFFREHLEHTPEGLTVELGSGGGFIKDILPKAKTSDVVALPNIDLVFSATALPFQKQSVSGILMINVLHHLQDVSSFFESAKSCLKPDGRIIMLEPANTLWSRFIYKNFHHEPFLPEQEEWPLPKGGRMSVANDALPWIVFCRDRGKFEKQFPEFEISLVQTCLPFRYLASGGVSKPQLLPNFCYTPLKKFEELLSPLNNFWGMFMRIVLRRCS